MAWAHTTAPTGSAGSVQGVLTWSTGMIGLEVLHGGSWVQIASKRADSMGRATLPLSYGVGTSGTYRFRLNATYDGVTTRTPAWSVVRSVNAAPKLRLDFGDGLTGVAQVTDLMYRITISNNSPDGRILTKTAAKLAKQLTWVPNVKPGTPIWAQWGCGTDVPFSPSVATHLMGTWSAGGETWAAADSQMDMPNLCAATFLDSAPNATWTGTAGFARGRVAYPRAGATAFLEVAYGTGWARIGTTKTDAAGSFTLPLSYGVHSKGRYHFRLGAVIDGRTTYSRDWWTYRLPTTTVTLMSANSTAPLRTPQVAVGRVTPYPDCNNGYLEVWTGNKWVQIGFRFIDRGSNTFTVGLTYGQYNRGTYRFRLRVDVYPLFVPVYSRTWTLTRT